MPVKVSGHYPLDWKAIAHRVKEEAGWQCIRCGHPHDPSSGYTLTVHHLTGEKNQCAWWNLAALCQRCHLQIQAKVDMDRPWILPHSEWFKPYAAGFYAHRFGFRDDREFVLANLDALLAIGQGFHSPSLYPKESQA